MEDLTKAAKEYIAARTTQGMTIEQQIMMAYAAGAIFGSRQVEAVVEAKYALQKANNMMSTSRPWEAHGKQTTMLDWLNKNDPFGVKK